MRSRIGLMPNGIHLLKSPDQHFEIGDFIQALDKWSKSIKDNPVTDFTAKIKIKQIHSFPVYQVFSERKYENRSLSNKREYANPHEYPKAPGVAWNSINAWDYNIAEKEDNQDIVLNDTIYSENCTRCNTTGKVVSACRSCSGMGYTVGERYENGRTYQVQQSCSSCGGDGRREDTCNVCNGYGGFVNYVVCHVKYSYPNWGQKYGEKSAAQVSQELQWAPDDFNYFKEVQSAKDFANFIAGDIRENSIADLISFINSNDSQNQHFIRERTIYGQTYVSFVQFSYEEGGEYTIVTYGEKDKIYAPDSPVSNCVDNLLAEADQCLGQSDLESASKIMKHIYKMNQKKNVADSFVINFLKKAGNSLEKVSHEKKIPEARQIEMRRVAQNFGTPVEKKNLFSFNAEIFSYFFIPAVGAIAYHMSQFNFKNPDFKMEIVDILTKTAMASAISLGIQYFTNRKKDLYYKKLWKYLLHGVLINAACVYLLSTAKNGGEILVWSLVIGAIQYVATIACEKLLDDKANIFRSTSHSEDINAFCQEFKTELADIKSHLPKDYSYIDQDIQNEYIKKARALEEITKANSENEEISFFTEDRKKIA